MSLQLRVRDRKVSVKRTSRQLLRSIEAPESHTTSSPACEAVDPDGDQCRIALATNTKAIWCDEHHRQWVDMDARWHETYEEAEKQIVLNFKTAKLKVMKLQLSVDLRRQIRHRFYPRGGDIDDYIEWIARLETHLRWLSDNLPSIIRSSPTVTSSDIQCSARSWSWANPRDTVG